MVKREKQYIFPSPLNSMDGRISLSGWYILTSRSACGFQNAWTVTASDWKQSLFSWEFSTWFLQFLVKLIQLCGALGATHSLNFGQLSRNPSVTLQFLKAQFVAIENDWNEKPIVLWDITWHALAMCKSWYFTAWDHLWASLTNYTKSEPFQSLSVGRFATRL